jgi:SAM-dependent methyltransferase
LRADARPAARQTSDIAGEPWPRHDVFRTKKEGADMVDVSKLAPAEMAQLLGKPEGEAGSAIGEMLNRTNLGITEAVYRRLHLRHANRVLEIGFGNGKLLPALLALADSITYVGFDIAATMVTEAAAFNAELVASGRASFHLGSVEALPCADESFHRVFAINVFYFWPDPVRALTEMRRVLRPDGVSIVAAVAPSIAATASFAREEFGFRLRDAETISALHREAGFGRVDIEPYSEVTTRPDGTPWERHYSLVVAQP